MRTTIFAALLGLLAINASASTTEEFFDIQRTDYCKDQAYDAIYEILGEDIQVVKVQSDSTGSKNSKSKNYWFSLKECIGHVVVSTFPINPQCKAPHYGRIPKYVSRMWATGDCKRLVPRQIIL